MPGCRPDPELRFIPYIRGISEHASVVRRALREQERDNFILAVDLPRGLETRILQAVKKLPRIHVIVDTLGRAVPILPTCGSIEAVRTFLETGADMEFIDTSLPICGQFEEWRRFSEYCREFGQDDVIARAEEYGIDLQGLLDGRDGRGSPPPPHFQHLTGASVRSVMNQSHPGDFPYLEARQRFMAMRLQALKKQGMTILAVCDVHNIAAVQQYLAEPSPTFDDTFRFDTVTCRVKEDDIIRISPEIPFFMHHYEIFRDQEWSREHWLQELLIGMEPAPDILQAQDILKYSRNLALTDGQIYPGLYNLLAAAKYCAGDAVAIRLMEQAASYPGADRDSNCIIRFFSDYNLNPLGDARVLELKDDLSRSTAWRAGNPRGRITARRRQQSLGVFRFTRTPESLQHERQFMHHLGNRFRNFQPRDEFRIEEFSCGLKDGIDARETLRRFAEDRIYVRDQTYENTAAYVVDFGEIPTWSVYFDTQYHMVGAARRRDAGTHTWVCFTAFLRPPVPMVQLLNDVDLMHPRESCLQIALEHADRVFLFTDTQKRPLTAAERSPGVQVLDIRALPEHLREAMRCFHVAS